MAKTDLKKQIETKKTDEHSELDAAMNELAKQTDALLAEAKPTKAEKPTLPKKKSVSKKVVPHRNGQHLDIVGSGMKSRPTPKLEAHATKSYNEKELPKKESEPTEKLSAATPQIIRPHEGRSRAGSEPVAPHETTSADKAENNGDDASTSAEKPRKTEHMKVEVDESESAIDVHSKPETDTSKAKEVELNINPETFSEKSASELKQDPEKVANKPQAENEPKPTKSNDANAKTVLTMGSDEDEDDGIVKMDEKEDGREKPTVYDTTEYQAELHDWSKLSKNSHWSFIILVLLLALAGGLMYLYFTGNLPEIV